MYSPTLQLFRSMIQLHSTMPGTAVVKKVNNGKCEKISLQKKIMLFCVNPRVKKGKARKCF